VDFGFWILDFGFWILDFGFWILDFGFWILDFGLREISANYRSFQIMTIFIIRTLRNWTSQNYATSKGFSEKPWMCP
jgi:hypothetical protein